jgi:5-methylcytosine-specific restriction endonuclease McrA
MLRRAENVRVSHVKRLFSSRGFVNISLGKTSYQVGKSKISSDEYLQRRQAQLNFPVFWARISDRSYYEFQGKFYWDNDNLTPHQVYALLVTRHQAQQRKIDRAESMVAMGDQRMPVQRGHIADDVKQFVWARDAGRCRHCGATTELQFDHIISLALGGSSEQENLQILCGPCNRRKAAGLTVRSHQQSAPRPATAATQPRPLPPAGWYPDPSTRGGRRYWDGRAWTQHAAP